MKQVIITLGSIFLLVCIVISGCDQISNIFLTDQDRLIGTWTSEGIWLDVPTLIEFSSNRTFNVEVELGLPLPINLSFSKGKWDINNGILTMEIIDMIPQTNYTYQFSKDNNILTITDIKSKNSYVLKRQ